MLGRGYLVLFFGEQRGPFIAWQSVAPALTLISLSLAPSLPGHASPIYFVGALLLSSSFLYYAAKLALLDRMLRAPAPFLCRLSIPLCYLF